MITTLYYLYLAVSFVDGTMSYEPKGPSGPTVQTCTKYGDWAVKNQVYVNAKEVNKVEAVCVPMEPPR